MAPAACRPFQSATTWGAARPTRRRDGPRPARRGAFWRVHHEKIIGAADWWEHLWPTFTITTSRTPTRRSLAPGAGRRHRAERQSRAQRDRRRRTVRRLPRAPRVSLGDFAPLPGGWLDAAPAARRADRAALAARRAAVPGAASHALPRRAARLPCPKRARCFCRFRRAAAAGLVRGLVFSDTLRDRLYGPRCAPPGMPRSTKSAQRRNSAPRLGDRPAVTTQALALLRGCPGNGLLAVDKVTMAHP